MTEAHSRSSFRRPTLLIGHGDFGTDVLRRLLSGAALRGTLEWEAPEGAAAPSERRLHRLALLSMGAQQDPLEGGESLDLMRDLYEQILVVDSGSQRAEQALVEEVQTTARRLRRARESGAPEEGLGGLDVLVVAHLERASDVGLLNRLMETTMTTLLDSWPQLESAVQGTERLNFIQLLDFGDYWSRLDRRHRELRHAVCGSLKRWHKRAREKKPAFRRIYLLDSETGDGSRELQDRAEEMALFLELLLFEGQRAGKLQKLYNRQRDVDPPAATFGIRLLEKPTGLLQRLIAAAFGVGWLGYMDGENRERAPDAPTTREFLEDYQRRDFGDLFGRTELETLLDQQAADLEDRLLRQPVNTADWPERIEVEYERGSEEIRHRLSEAASQRMEILHGQRLRGFASDLRSAIDSDLHDESDPTPPGLILSLIDGTLRYLERRSLEPGMDPKSETSPASDPLESIGELHSLYRRLQRARIRPAKLRWWWPIFAALGTAGALPLAIPLVEDLVSLAPQPDPAAGSPWAVMLHGLLERLTHPTAIGFGLFLTVLGLTGIGFRRALSRRTERAVRFFEHPERGRLAGRIRAGMAPGGALRSPLESFLTHLLSDMQSAVFSELRGELGRVRARLDARRRELLWLRRDLRKFLQLNGVTEEGRRTGAQPARAGRGLRASLEVPADLERLARSNPLHPDRYRSLQAKIKPFRAWDRDHSQAFLYPLAFIERLSREFHTAPVGESVRAARDQEEERWSSGLQEFLQRKQGFDVGLSIPEQEGAPGSVLHALIPARLSKASGPLNEASYRVDQIIESADPERIYLLRTKTGIPPEVLDGAEVRR